MVPYYKNLLKLMLYIWIVISELIGLRLALRGLLDTKWLEKVKTENSSYYSVTIQQSIAFVFVISS
jgi:hypothetical protein